MGEVGGWDGYCLEVGQNGCSCNCFGQRRGGGIKQWTALWGSDLIGKGREMINESNETPGERLKIC